MTAPSPKEALELKPCPFCNTAPAFGRMIEPDQVTIGCNNDGCLVQLCVVSDVESEAVKAWNTRATLQPSGERREAIARTLAEKWPGDYMQGDDECEREPNALAYETADVALLASGLVQDEAGIRADYVSVPLEPTQAMVAAGEEVCCASARDNCATIYRAMIAAIRSARDGGAS